MIPPEVLEHLLAELDENTQAALERWEETWRFLAEHPVDLNVAAAGDLVLIPGLGPMLARRIVAFRDRFGPFRSVGDLRAVEGVSGVLFRAIQPFVRVRTNEEAARASGVRPTRRVRIEASQVMARRIERSRGYTDPAGYAGSPLRSATRISISTNRVGGHLVGEKDPGEAFVRGPGRRAGGYDFLSGSLQLGSAENRWGVVLGDLRVRFGMGSVLGSGSFGADPVREAGRMLHPRFELRPHRSTTEWGFARGLGGRLSLPGHVHVAAVVSRKRRDGSVQAHPGEGTDVFISSLAEDGLHRSAAERKRRGAILERLAAAHLAVDRRRFVIGGSFLQAELAPPLHAADPAGGPFGREVSRLRAVSFHAGVHTLSGSAAVEVARLLPGPAGGHGGFTVEPVSDTEFTFFARYFPPGFVNPWGSTIGAPDGLRHGHLGLLWGVRTHPRPGTSMELSVEQLRFLWARGTALRPSERSSIRLRVGLPLGRRIDGSASLAFRREEAGAVWPDPRGLAIRGLAPAESLSGRLLATWSASRTLRVRLEARWKHGMPCVDPRLSCAPESGLAFRQDIRLRIGPRLEADASLLSFATDGYAARLVVVETGVPHAFNAVTLYGRGERLTARLRLRMATFLEAWGFFGVTRYDAPRTIGSGLGEVRGIRTRDVRAAARLRW